MSIIIDGTNGISDIDGTASTPAIRGTDTNTGIFFPAADTVAISEGGVESARFNSSGNLQLVNSLSVGNATPTTSGIGITFPATQSASTDANTLDDYEEGTWTPTLNTGTLSNASGRYRKIGSQVTVWAVVSGFSDRASASNVEINNLPFTTSGDAAGGSTMAKYINTLTTLTPWAANNGVTIRFYNVASGNYTILQHNQLNNNDSTIYFFYTYVAA